MWIEAILNRDELRSAIDDLLPLKIHFGEDGSQQRYVLLRGPVEAELVPDRGLEVRSAAEIHGSESIHLTLATLRFVVHPQIEVREGKRVLATRLDVEESDFAHLPAVLDSGIAHLVDVALASHPMIFDFAALLTRSFALPDRVEPLRSLDLQTGEARCTIDGDSIRLGVDVDLSFSRHARAGAGSHEASLHDRAR